MKTITKFSFLKIATTAVVVALVVACAAHYAGPRVAPQVFSGSVSAPKGTIFKAAAYVLRTSGYRVAFSSREKGRLSTQPRKMNLTNSDCDCGSVLGNRYMSDAGTRTRVSITVVAQDNAFTLQATVAGEHTSAEGGPAKAIRCVSRGKIEKALVSKIEAFVETSGGQSEPSQAEE